MAEKLSDNRTSSAFAGLILGLATGGLALISAQVVLPRFFETPLQVLTIAAIWSLLGVGVSLAASIVGRHSSVAVTAALLGAIVVIGFSKLLLPSSLWWPFLASLVAALAVGGLVLRRAWTPGRRTLLMGLVLTLIAIVFPMFNSRSQAIGARLVVVGLDAGTWTVLDELFEQGDLPHIRQMVDQGVAGTLLSKEPTLSPRVWTSIATGKEPAKHGIQDFFSTQNRDLKAARFWEILLRFDFSVGLFRWLVTWPPDPIGPFNVPGWMARDSSTIPERLSFVKEVERKFQNDVKASLGPAEALRWGVMYLRSGVGFDTCLEVSSLALKQWLGDHPWEAGYATKRTMHDLLNMDVYLDLMERQRPDVSAVVFYGSDNLAHKVWKYRYPDEFGLDPSTASLGEFLDNYYREVDRFLGELRKLVGDETSIFLISDHGYGSSEGQAGVVQRQTVFKPRMVNILEFLELDSPSEATVASVSTRGYITFKGSEEESEKRLDDTRQVLEAVQVASNGLQVFRLTKTDTGQLEVAIVDAQEELQQDTQLQVDGRSLVLSDLVEVEERGGAHSVEGILIAQGPHILEGVRLADSHLVDVAPTLLYLLEVPVADDMDGRVLQEMFDPRFLAGHPPESVTSYDDSILQQRERGWEEGDEETLKKELEALGYLN